MAVIKNGLAKRQTFQTAMNENASKSHTVITLTVVPEGKNPGETHVSGTCMCAYVCVYMSVYICMYACVRACMCVHLPLCQRGKIPGETSVSGSVCVHVCAYVCMYVSVCVCVHETAIVVCFC
jgi:hypothetical protein